MSSQKKDFSTVLWLVVGGALLLAYGLSDSGEGSRPSDFDASLNYSDFDASSNYSDFDARSYSPPVSAPITGYPGGACFFPLPPSSPAPSASPRFPRLCGGCDGSGACGVCNGDGNASEWSYNLGPNFCSSCGGTGRCFICGGSGTR